MRTSMAYFAGVGTVVAAVVAGLGGGVLISNTVSPHAPRTEMSKLELRMSERPIQATNASSEPAPIAASAPARPAEAQAAENATASTSPAAPPPQAAAPVTQAVASEKMNSEQNKTPEAAFAKARDSDLKPRDADVRREARRAAEEKRKAERRQQWVERRRPRQNQELREVEEKVREETEPRQMFAVEPVKLEVPRIRLFDSE
jgi:hypothetical protein